MADDLDDIFEVGQGRRSAAESSSSAESSEFPALRVIADIYMLIAIVAFVAGVIGVIVLLATKGDTALPVIVAVAWTLLVPLGLWGTGELILLLLRIERNTRTASELLSSASRRG